MSEQPSPGGSDGGYKQAIDYNMVTFANLANEAFRSQVIPLREALRAAIEDDNHSLLVSRPMMLQRAHMPIDTLAGLYRYCADSGKPLAIVEHPPLFSAAEKEGLLATMSQEIESQLGFSAPVKPVKTLSMRFYQGEYPVYVLLTGVGDFRVEKEDKKIIAEIMNASNGALKNAVINPPELDTTLVLGQIPGTVGPFIEHHLLSPNPLLLPQQISEIIYLEKEGSDETLVALSSSPIDTVIVRKDTFRGLLNWWGKEFEDYMTAYPTNLSSLEEDWLNANFSDLGDEPAKKLD